MSNSKQENGRRVASPSPDTTPVASVHEANAPEASVLKENTHEANAHVANAPETNVPEANSSAVHPGGVPPASTFECKDPELPANKSRSSASRLKIVVLASMPVLLGLYFWLSNPFRDELVCEVYSLRDLNPSQCQNIELASRYLDGRVLKPGELFSFNRTVGPRWDRRGYRPAPTYVGPNSPSTVGGGICLLSSALYQAVLACGLKVEERNPHLRTIATVAPGLDATVWYGRQDLKFRNTTRYPLQLNARCADRNLYVSILGEHGKDLQIAQLKTVVTSQSHSEILVEAFREVNGKRTFVSRDHYQINR